MSRPEMITVCVTTFERPRELALVLEGLLRQQDAPPFEIKVCDDGSPGPETGEVVRAVAARAAVPIEHLVQPNDGFRAAAARNMGVRAAKGDYVVFVDGDCVPFGDFLARHAELAAPGRFVVGDRHFLDEEPSARVTAEDVRAGRHEKLAPPEEDRRQAKRARKIKFYQLTGLKKDRPKMVTANAAVWRADLEAINGLDERFVGWGHEDDDLGRRLARHGVRPASAIGIAKVAHLWHKPQETFAGRVRDCPNAPYFHRGFFIARCAKGLRERPWDDYRLRVHASSEELAARAQMVMHDRLRASPPDAPALGPEGADLELVLLGADGAGGGRAAPAWNGAAQVRVLAVLPGAGEAAPRKLAKQAHVLVTARGLDPAAVTGGKPVHHHIELDLPGDPLPREDALAALFEAVRDVV